MSERRIAGYDWVFQPRGHRRPRLGRPGSAGPHGGGADRGRPPRHLLVEPTALRMVRATLTAQGVEIDRREGLSMADGEGRRASAYAATIGGRTGTSFAACDLRSSPLPHGLGKAAPDRKSASERYYGAPATSARASCRLALRHVYSPANPYSEHAPARELGNQYALRALRERRAFMTGELLKLEERRRFLKESLTHIDATIALMAPGVDPTLIKACFPKRKAKLFGAGKLNHLILGVLRKGERPMSMEEIVQGVVADGGWDEADPAAARGMKLRVRSGLLYLASVRGLVVKKGERAEAKWSLSS